MALDFRCTERCTSFSRRHFRPSPGIPRRPRPPSRSRPGSPAGQAPARSGRPLERRPPVKVLPAMNQAARRPIPSNACRIALPGCLKTPPKPAAASWPPGNIEPSRSTNRNAYACRWRVLAVFLDSFVDHSPGCVYGPPRAVGDDSGRKGSGDRLRYPKSVPPPVVGPSWRQKPKVGGCEGPGNGTGFVSTRDTRHRVEHRCQYTSVLTPISCDLTTWRLSVDLSHRRQACRALSSSHNWELRTAILGV